MAKMWPVSNIAETIQSNRSRKECLNEILEALEREGIDLIESRLTTKKRRRSHGEVVTMSGKVLISAPIDEMENYQKTQTQYSLDFWIGELVYGSTPFSTRLINPIPKGFIEHSIGQTTNKNYASQKAQYEIDSERVHRDLGKVARELDVTWLINSSLCDPHFTGPQDESWAREQPIWKQAYEVYRTALVEWERTPMSEWEKRNPKEGINCECYGGSYPSDGGGEIRCDKCNGEGKLYPSAEEYKILLKPREPTLSFIPPSQNQIEVEAIRKGIEKPSMPIEHALVYMRVTPKE